MRLRWLIVVVLLTWVRTSTARTALTPMELFKQAENTFRFQDYPRAVKQLEALLYPRPKTEDRTIIIKSHEYLGACFYWLKNYKRMAEEFTALLVMDPKYKLDPFYYPVPLIERFNKLRNHLISLGIIHVTPKSAHHKPKQKTKKVKTRLLCRTMEKEVIQRNKALCYIPFGVGQFANNRSDKAAAFLSTQIIGLGVNIGAFSAIEAIRGDDGLFSASGARKARILRYVQYAGLGLFVASALWGILDALHDFKARQVKTRIIVTPCPKGVSVGVKF